MTSDSKLSTSLHKKKDRGVDLTDGSLIGAVVKGVVRGTKAQNFCVFTAGSSLDNPLRVWHEATNNKIESAKKNGPCRSVQFEQKTEILSPERLRAAYGVKLLNQMKRLKIRLGSNVYYRKNPTKITEKQLRFFEALIAERMKIYDCAVAKRL